MKGEV